MCLYNPRVCGYPKLSGSRGITGNEWIINCLRFDREATVQPTGNTGAHTHTDRRMHTVSKSTHPSQFESSKWI